MSLDYQDRHDALLRREYKRYKARGGKDLTDAEIQDLIDRDLVNKHGLTKLGHLTLHQLKLLEWMKKKKQNA